MEKDISVIIATYNRALDLSKTLEGMVKTVKGDLAIEYVVVDNGSNDQTKSVVDTFYDRIPINYIFELRSGKNRALNTALEKCKLGKIVIFTDDDVDVSPDWFVSILSVCDRWPNHAVFGGRINVNFPIKDVPKWALDPFLSSVAFSHHHYSDQECLYGDGLTPFGPNFWVRREVFDNGRRFNEAIGPRPTNRMMGSETSFLMTLLKEGYEIVYSPTVVVGHRIQRRLIGFYPVCRRAYRLGRGEAHIHDLTRPIKLDKYWPSLRQNITAWRFYLRGSIILSIFKVFIEFIYSSKEKRTLNVASKLRKLGYKVEASRILREHSIIKTPVMRSTSTQ